MEWRIFYDDGSTFSDEDGTPEQAPARGVIAIVCRDPVARWVVCSRFDYYVWRGEWFGVDIFGLFDYLVDPGWKGVTFGRTIANEEFRKIHTRACDLKRELLDG